MTNLNLHWIEISGIEFPYVYVIIVCKCFRTTCYKNSSYPMQMWFHTKIYFFPYLGCLKGNDAQYHGNHVIPCHYNTPLSSMERYREVYTTGCIMFVNAIWFFLGFSHHIQFITDYNIGNAYKRTLMKSIKRVNKIYLQHGF